MFDLGTLPGTKYKVSGEPEVTTVAVESTRPRYQLPLSTGSGWGPSRPWLSRDEGSGPSSAINSRNRPRYEACLKRTIPFVTLCPDQSCRSMCIDTVISNLYLKIPESEVSLDAILTAAGPKVDVAMEQLVLLDSTFVPVTDDGKGRQKVPV